MLSKDEQNCTRNPIDLSKRRLSQLRLMGLANNSVSILSDCCQIRRRHCRHIFKIRQVFTSEVNVGIRRCKSVDRFRRHIGSFRYRHRTRSVGFYIACRLGQKDAVRLGTTRRLGSDQSTCTYERLRSGFIQDSSTSA
jgi:hypothetical protein